MGEKDVMDQKLIRFDGLDMGILSPSETLRKHDVRVSIPPPDEESPMARKLRPWFVAPHGPLEKLEDNLWTIDAPLPGTPLSRRMAIIKRSDGTLLFFQAVPVGIRGDVVAQRDLGQ